MNKSKGFTLIEVLVVLAILVVLAGTVVANLSGHDIEDPWESTYKHCMEEALPQAHPTETQRTIADTSCTRRADMMWDY